MCGNSTNEDIENEARAVATLCSGGASKYVVEVLRHGWLTNIYYFIDMEYCPETLEDRLNGWKEQSNSFATPQVGPSQFFSSTTETPGRKADILDQYVRQSVEIESVSEVHTSIGMAAGSDSIDWRPIMAIFLDITKGLRYIHSKGFVHRDLKPKNGTV
jgi:serine/threonine protein kinase